MVDCALAGVTVNALELYRCGDPDALTWLGVVVQRVSEAIEVARGGS